MNELSDKDVTMGNDTPKWRYMKKQMMVAIKQHGDGLKNLEAMTLKHGVEMLQKMEKYAGKPFDPAELLNTTIASIMLTLIYGHTTEEDVKKHIACEKQALRVFQANGAFLMLDVFPILRFIVPSVRKAYAELIAVINNFVTLYDKIVAARRRLYKHPQVEYFIDHFLKLSITNKSEEDKARIVDELDVRAVGSTMFGAGMITTYSTMQMMLAILVNHPEIQDQIYAEINEVIGKRNPTMEDRQSMPLTESLILETLRYHSLAMFAIPHQARCDAELNGFFIPKGT